MSSVCLKIIDRNKMPLRITTRYTQQTTNLYKTLIFTPNISSIQPQSQNMSNLIYSPYIQSFIHKTITTYVVLINDKNVNKRGLYT